MLKTVMVKTLMCPICNRNLREYTNESKSTKNTYTMFDLDEDTRVIICNHCSFAGSSDQFAN